PQAPPYGQQPAYGQQPTPPYGQQPPYGQPPYGVPQPPPPGGGGKKTGLIIGAVAVVAAIGVGAYFVIGGGGGAGGLKDDGPHRLDTPATALTDYKRVGKGGESTDADTAKYLTASGVKDGKAVIGQWSTADFGDYDPQNPDPADLPSQAELLTARGFSMLGGYGKIANPESSLDTYFAVIQKELQSSNSSASSSSTQGKTELIGQPEEADIDGAVMKCQSLKSTNSLTKKESTDWFCVWADYSTIAMVSPGDNTKSITKDVAIDITTKLRDQVRVKA
ncbi:hypothetical protein, partial [Streptomyces sp. AK04-3B]|uniref:hypothetical protein n=1 Tax=Streptomyces sp. AK04-3B TaxID=3028650 RepID=UPI0029BED06C